MGPRRSFQTSGIDENCPAPERPDQIQDLRVPPGLGEGGLQLVHCRPVQAEVVGGLQRGTVQHDARLCSCRLFYFQQFVLVKVKLNLNGLSPTCRSASSGL